jgi:hypothetical protein
MISAIERICVTDRFGRASVEKIGLAGDDDMMPGSDPRQVHEDSVVQLNTTR